MTIQVTNADSLGPMLLWSESIAQVAPSRVPERTMIVLSTNREVEVVESVETIQDLCRAWARQLDGKSDY